MPTCCGRAEAEAELSPRESERRPQRESTRMLREDILANERFAAGFARRRHWICEECSLVSYSKGKVGG